MRVVELWRYPVKSMQGEQLSRADVGRAGIVGDRAFALRDRTTGLTLTARRQPELLFATGRIVDGQAVVTLPDGTETNSDEVLSSWLQRDVELVAATERPATYEIADDFEDETGSPWSSWNGPGWAFHDSIRARVSIIGRDTLGDWPVRRFRPNVVVEGGGEDALVGTTVRNASGLVLDVIKRIDRCVMITRPQPGGIERDLDVLRTVHRERQSCVGIGATIAEPGDLQVGDQLA